MRALTLVAFALIVAALGGVSAQTAGTTQAAARALEDKWPNCSKVHRGRLQAAHPDSDHAVFTGIFTGVYNFTENNKTVVSYNISAEISPCLVRPLPLTDSSGFITLKFNNNKPAQLSQYELTYDNVVSGLAFTLPVALGEVAAFTAKYSLPGNEHNFTFITLNVRCGNTDLQSAVVTVKDGQAYLTLTAIDACPRFPYTNEDLPAGGVIALIVTIVIFVIEFSICGWYHKTHKIDVPFADRDATYQSME